MSYRSHKPPSTASRRYKRSSLGKTETTRNETRYNVTVVWGGKDLTPRTTVTPDRRKALRIAQSIAERGARIVLVKKGSFNDGYKLIADFSTVGGES